MGAGVDQDNSAVRSNPHPASPLPPPPSIDEERPILVLDVGSSWTKPALVESGGQLVRLDAFPSSAGSWTALLRRALAPHGLDLPLVRRVVASSVVPGVTDELRAMVEQPPDIASVELVAAETAPLRIDYRPLSDLGADRIANAVAASDRWGTPVVVVDVGTAITCDLLAADGRFAGGAIAAGPRIGYESLAAAAPQLALALARAGLADRTEHVDAAGVEVVRHGAAGGVAGPLELADEVLTVGRSTQECLLVGAVRGAAGLVDGLVRGYRRLVGDCPVVVTGGLATAVARHSETITVVDPDLTLRGTYLACLPSAGGRPGRRLAC